MRAFHGTVAFLAVLVAPPGVLANEPGRAQLTYVREVGAEACPDEAALRAAVLARLGRDPFLQQAEGSVSVRMTVVGQRLQALIRTENLSEQTQGQRELFGDVSECSELVSSAALAIAIAIDPQVLTRVASDEPSAPPVAPQPAPAKAPAPPSPQRRKVAAASARSVGWYELALGAQATWRSVPGLGLLVDLRGSTRRFSLGLQGSGVVEGTRELAGGAVDVAGLEGSLVACWRLSWLGLCGRGGLGGQRITASGYPDARRGWLLVSTFGPRVEAGGLVSGRFGLRLHLDAAVSPRAVELKRSGDTIGRLPRFGTSVAAATFFRFP